MENDTYKTIKKASRHILYKDKNSKFFGYAFPVTIEDEVKHHLEVLKKKHHAARHWCYAYQFGKQANEIVFRANDDGEPNNSAGMPIYGQILSFGVTNVLVVVVRYYGGTKLGVSGLITAYKSTAQMALEASKVVTKTMNVNFEIAFEYKQMNTVMRIIKEKKLDIINQTMELKCKIIISVRLKESQQIFDHFFRLHEINITALND